MNTAEIFDITVNVAYVVWSMVSLQSSALELLCLQFMNCMCVWWLVYRWDKLDGIILQEEKQMRSNTYMLIPVINLLWDSLKYLTCSHRQSPNIKTIWLCILTHFYLSMNSSRYWMCSALSSDTDKTCFLCKTWDQQASCPDFPLSDPIIWWDEAAFPVNWSNIPQYFRNLFRVPKRPPHCLLNLSTKYNVVRQLCQ